MEKRKLSAIPRPSATKEMIEVADRLGGMRHIVTADLVDDKKILLLNFFEIKALKNGKTEAAFRTFLSHDDYITQDLKTSKVKWITGSFDRMDNFSLMDYAYNQQEHKSSYRLNVFMRSDEELKIVKYFFREYSRTDDKYSPWVEIHRFQQEVLDKRLAEKHKKETDKIDVVMNPIKDAPKEFFDWVWNTGMSFARYLIYKEVEKGKALCECTHCKQHNYLFLTKNPERYADLDLLSADNMFYGTSITREDEMHRFNFLPAFRNRFVSIEPILEDMQPEKHNLLFRQVDWVILGAETGLRRGKVIPDAKWIWKIVELADREHTPIFMKDSLINIVGEENMRRDFPEQLLVRKKSEKVLKKLMGECVECHDEMEKNKMVSLSARSKRGGKTSSFAYMCRPCFIKWCKEHGVEIPKLEGLENEK